MNASLVIRELSWVEGDLGFPTVLTALSVLTNNPWNKCCSTHPSPLSLVLHPLAIKIKLCFALSFQTNESRIIFCTLAQSMFYSRPVYNLGISAL